MTTHVEPVYAIPADAVDPLANAFDALGGLTQAIASTLSVVSTEAPLGPWELDVTCTYGFLGFYTEHYTYDVDFAPPRNYLENVLAEARQQSESFVQSYAPFERWVTVTVPATTTKFQTTGDLVAKAIAAGSGITPTQRSAVLTAVDDLRGDLGASVTQLKSFIETFSQFLEQQDDWQASIAAAEQWYQGQGQQQLTDIGNFINDQHCSGDAWDQLSSFQSQFTTSTGLFSTSMGALLAATRQADDGLALLIGTVDDFATSIGLAIDQLGKAQGEAFVLILLQLHFDVALDTWNRLAEDASHQVPPLLQLAELANQLAAAPEGAVK
jgi:hypothetical protein